MSTRWDKYFLGICKEVGKNTKCMSRQIGAILVIDNSIVATGYNGPPRGIPHCNTRAQIDHEFCKELIKRSGLCNYEAERYLEKCPRQLMKFKSGEGLEWCVAGHAERNCLINAARTGVCTRNTTMYMDCGIPCTPCMVEIINAGVKEIVVTKFEFYDKSSEFLLRNSNLCFRIFEV
jgi:dCMP deaminase